MFLRQHVSGRELSGTFAILRASSGDNAGSGARSLSPWIGILHWPPQVQFGDRWIPQGTTVVEITDLFTIPRKAKNCISQKPTDSLGSAK